MPLNGNERGLNGGGEGMNGRAFKIFFTLDSTLCSLLCCCFYMLRREKLQQQHDGLCVPGLTSRARAVRSRLVSPSSDPTETGRDRPRPAETGVNWPTEDLGCALAFRRLFWFLKVDLNIWEGFALCNPR